MLGAADAGVRTMTKRLVVGDFVLREGGLHRGGGAAEKPHHRTAGPQHADDLSGQRLRRGLRQIVEDVPAQDAVDAPVLVAEALVDRAGKVVQRARARVPIVVGKQILDEQLAPELLAEKRDVGADHRTEIDRAPATRTDAQSPTRNFGSAFEATRVSPPRAAGASPGGSGWPGRLPPQRRMSDSMK